MTHQRPDDNIDDIDNDNSDDAHDSDDIQFLCVSVDIDDDDDDNTDRNSDDDTDIHNNNTANIDNSNIQMFCVWLTKDPWLHAMVVARKELSPASSTSSLSSNNEVVPYIVTTAPHDNKWALIIL